MKTIDFNQYLRDFDYNERKAMKNQLPELLELYQQDQGSEARYPLQHGV